MLKEALDINQFSTHNDRSISMSCTLKDENDVAPLTDMLVNNWIKPLSGEHSDLVCISTGVAAAKNIKDDLLQAKR